MVLIITPMRKRRSWVAIVDDEVDLAQLFSDALNTYGIKAKAFNNPISATDYFYHHHDEFSLVITDWRMPGMNGLELTKLIKQMDDQIRVIVMSAFELGEDQLKEIKMDEYLRKPMHMTQLIETVKKQLLETEVVANL